MKESRSDEAADRRIKRPSLRSCIVCRQRAEKSELLRLICTSDGQVVFDVTGKQQGRGAYVHRKLPCILKLPSSKSWRHAFRRSDVNGQSIRDILPELSKRANLE